MKPKIPMPRGASEEEMVVSSPMTRPRMWAGVVNWTSVTTWILKIAPKRPAKNMEARALGPEGIRLCRKSAPQTMRGSRAKTQDLKEPDLLRKPEPKKPQSEPKPSEANMKPYQSTGFRRRSST